MKISQLQITVSAFYRCPSHFQMIGFQPSRRSRLFRSYLSNPMLASQSLCSSSQPPTICNHRGSKSKYMEHHSRALHQDVSLPISLEVFHDTPVPPTSTVMSSVEDLMSLILSVKNDQFMKDLDLYSASCDTFYPFVEKLNSDSAPANLLLCASPQSDSLEPYLNSPIHCQTNSGLQQPFLRTHPTNELKHLSYNTGGLSLSHLPVFSSQQSCLTALLVPSRHSHAKTSQPIKSSTIPRHFSLGSALTLHPASQPIKPSQIPSRHFSMDSFYITLSQSPPVQTAQSLLLDLHQWLPWWLVIPMATLAVRTLVVLPLAVHQAQVVARLAGVNAEMAKLAPELNKEVAVAKRMFGWDATQAKKVFKIQLRQLYQSRVVRDNCHPFKMVILVAFQMPLWVCLSVSLRNLTAMADAGALSAFQLKSEGLLWFTDLTSPDPIFIPLMLLAVNLSLTEVHALRQVGKGGLLQKVMLNTSRVVIFVVAAAATFNPSSVTFYWLCSSTFGLCQSLLLMSPRIKRALGIPKMASETATPYQDIANNLRKRLRR